MAIKFPTISVIIPTWNRAFFIKSAIDSVLMQTYPVWEILVCDDGSTDDTREIVLGYEDKKVIFVEGVHSGLPSVVRNRGMLNATGSYIAFLDSDDEWEPLKLEKQMDLVGKSKTRASASNAIRVLGDFTEDGFLLTYNKDLISINDLIMENNIICSSLIFETKLIDEIGLFPEDKMLTVGEDYAYWMRLSLFTSISYVNEGLVRYMDNPQKSIRKYSPSNLVLQIRIYRSFFRWLFVNKKILYLKILFKFIFAYSNYIFKSFIYKPLINSIAFNFKIRGRVFSETLYYLSFFFKYKFFIFNYAARLSNIAKSLRKKLLCKI